MSLLQLLEAYIKGLNKSISFTRMCEFFLTLCLVHSNFCVSIIIRAVTSCSICSCKYFFKYTVYDLKYVFYAIEYALYAIEYAHYALKYVYCRHRSNKRSVVKRLLGRKKGECCHIWRTFWKNRNFLILINPLQ